MITPYFCPNCGLRLWEDRMPGGGITADSYWCRNMHAWVIKDDPDDPEHKKVVMKGTLGSAT
jgi:hypothetical protein